MNSFAQAVEKTFQSPELTTTENGATAYVSSLDAIVDLFFAIGASRGKDIIPLFEKAFAADSDLAVRTALWARDIRQGAGERKLFRDILQFVETKDIDLFKRMIDKVSELGRWDDVLVAQTDEGFVYSAYVLIYSIYSEYQNYGVSTASKWTPRKGPVSVKLRAAWGLTPKQYRKLLVNTSKTVEQKMCAKQWDQIEFSKVPSLAMARYSNAFGKNAPESFNSFKESLKKGETTVKASAVYPYDVLKTVKSGDRELADEQWKALPNYLGNNFILPMIDVSGSMDVPVSGKTTAMDVAVSLGLYMADKQTGPFANMSLTFSTEPKFQIYNPSDSFSDKYYACKNASWGMSTNLQAAFEEILNVAIKNEVSKEDMPKYLVILSDQEFNAATNTHRYYQKLLPEVSTMFEVAKKLFNNSGYDLPKVVFWNLVSRNQHVPVTENEHGVALVSGFSPTIVRSVLAADMNNFNPKTIVLDTIKNTRYDH